MNPDVNRYVEEGVRADVRAGKSVLLVGPLDLAANVFGRVVDGSDEWSKVRRAHGVQSATHPSGGTLVVYAPTSGLRGRRCDVAVVLASHRQLPESQQAELWLFLQQTPEYILID